jgi:hypothetical protein
MNIYKAFLDKDFNVKSFEEPTDVVEVYSYKRNKKYNIELDSIKIYLELNGFLTTYKDEQEEEEFVMYLDSDYNFHTIWDNETSIFVLNQIKDRKREEIWKELQHNGFDSETEFKSSLKTYPKILGVKEVKIGDINFLSHAMKNGIWSSHNNTVCQIDRLTGQIKGLEKGKAILSYTLDTGFDLFNVFHEIIVK